MFGLTPMSNRSSQLMTKSLFNIFGVACIVWCQLNHRFKRSNKILGVVIKYIARAMWNFFIALEVKSPLSDLLFAAMCNMNASSIDLN